MNAFNKPLKMLWIDSLEWHKLKLITMYGGLNLIYKMF